MNDLSAPGWHVTVVESTASTNSDLAAAAIDGAPDRCVLIARHQTSGRGRFDRTWEAPPDTGLLMSILFRDLPGDPHQLVQRVAVAAARSCASWSRVAPRLKWPNDVLVDDAKLAGLLAQAGSDTAGRPFVVVGIGINVGWAPDGAARLIEGVGPLDVAAALLAELDRLPVDIATMYRDHLATLGRRVRVELPSGSVEGVASDVEPDGRLVVIDGTGTVHRFAAGDVVHLR